MVFRTRLGRCSTVHRHGLAPNTMRLHKSPFFKRILLLTSTFFVVITRFCRGGRPIDRTGRLSSSQRQLSEGGHASKCCLSTRHYCSRREYLSERLYTSTPLRFTGRRAIITLALYTMNRWICRLVLLAVVAYAQLDGECLVFYKRREKH